MTPFENAKAALKVVFSDKRKPKEKRIEDLDILRDQIHLLIEKLEEN